MEIIAEVSARHIHLKEEDFITLFGEGASLKSIKKLSQEDDFAAEETVKLAGPEESIDNVRVVGPFRDHSQVELSYSEARKLGVNPPLKVSGHLPGVNIKVIGPKGEIEKDIAIIAKRHLHLSPEEAEFLNLHPDEIVSVKCLGERETIFNQVVVRIKPKYTTKVHFDIDEANAAGIKMGDKVELITK
jgi:putative phosphotransacetylase